jgi:hypothetical protein
MGAVSLAICKAAKEAGVHIETDTEVCFSRALSFVGSCKISQILNYNFRVLFSFSI